MALLSDYTAGTVSIAAGGTAATGVGTAWLAAGFREGDLFFAAGWSAIIQSVNSNTSLTLYPTGIRGAALAGAGYRLRYQSDGSRVSAQARQLIDLFGTSGNLEALGGLTGANGKIPFFTGPGAMSSATLAELGYTANDVLLKLLTVDTNTSGLNSNFLQGLSLDDIKFRYVANVRLGASVSVTAATNATYRTYTAGAGQLISVVSQRLATKDIDFVEQRPVQRFNEFLNTWVTVGTL